jgi:hypothetical protein
MGRGNSCGLRVEVTSIRLLAAVGAAEEKPGLVIYTMRRISSA